MYIYLEHEGKRTKIPIKNTKKYEQYKKQGYVDIKGKRYTIIDPLEELRRNVQYLKRTKSWPK